MTVVLRQASLCWHWLVALPWLVAAVGVVAMVFGVGVAAT